MFNDIFLSSTQGRHPREDLNIIILYETYPLYLLFIQTIEKIKKKKKMGISLDFILDILRIDAAADL